MDTIFIKGLVFSGRHGVWEEERKVSQRFGVDIEVGQTPRDWQEDLSNTFDYMEARGIARHIVEGESFRLIETIAERILAKVLALPGVSEATVIVRKLDVAAPAEAGVRITRKN